MPQPTDAPQATCETCEHSAPARRHPCRFERACACWYGVPCNGTGKRYDQIVRPKTTPRAIA